MNGKSKCKILKDIRRQIAQDNDIEFVTSECRYQGDCSGTCPKCEAELQYLENELRKRQAAGKAIAVAGIAATLMLGAAGCGGQTPTEQLDGDIALPSTSSSSSTTETEPLMGESVVEDDGAGDSVSTKPTGDPFYDGEPGVEEDGNWGGLF